MAGNRRKNVKSYNRRGGDGVTTGLLVGILAVGLCILAVSIVGLMGVSGNTGGNSLQSAPQGNAGTMQQGGAQAGTNSGTTVTPGATGNQGGTSSDVMQNVDTENLPSTAPASDEEWLNFFNTAVNKLKTDTPAMTKSKQTQTVDIKLSNPLGDAYVGAAKDKYLSNEVVETPIAKGDTASAKANISPDGADFVSALTLADIKSIQGGVDSTGNYVITIAMNDMSNPEMSGPYGKIFQFMTVDDVMNTYAPGMGATVDRSNVEVKFTNCTASATITPDGQVVSYQTTVNGNLLLKEAKIKIITTDLDATLFSETKYYNIAW